MKTAKQALEGSWFAAEHEHPIFAALRDPENNNADALGRFAQDDETTQRAILHKVLPPLGNIVKARSWLKSGDLDPLRFAPVVAQAKLAMMVPPRSVRAAVVSDMVADSKGGFTEWALNALGIGLSLLSIVPGVGAVARGLAAVTGLALDLRAMGAAAGEYALISTAGGTDIDQAHALSNEAPSLQPLIISVIAVGLGAGGLATTLRQMRQLHSIAATGGQGGDDLIRILNETGQAKGVGNLGDDVADAAKGAHAADTAKGGKGTDTTPLPEHKGRLDTDGPTGDKAKPLDGATHGTGPGAAHQFDESFSTNRTYEASPKHGGRVRSVGGKKVAKEPSDGAAALEFSFPISNNTTRRVGIDVKNDEFVVFDRTTNTIRDKAIVGGTYHGHVRTWDELDGPMKAALEARGVVKKGKINVDPSRWDR